MKQAADHEGSTACFIIKHYQTESVLHETADLLFLGLRVKADASVYISAGIFTEAVVIAGKNRV